MASWYDHPQYFDMAFRDETAAEVKFFEQAFDRFATGPVKRLLERSSSLGKNLPSEVMVIDTSSNEIIATTSEKTGQLVVSPSATTTYKLD